MASDYYSYGESELSVSSKEDSDSSKCCSKSTVLLADDLVFNMIPLEQILKKTYGLKCDKA